MRFLKWALEIRLCGAINLYSRNLFQLKSQITIEDMTEHDKCILLIYVTDSFYICQYLGFHFHTFHQNELFVNVRTFTLPHPPISTFLIHVALFEPLSTQKSTTVEPLPFKDQSQLNALAFLKRYWRCLRIHERIKPQCPKASILSNDLPSLLWV